MGATVIDGNALAEELSAHVHQELEQLKISGSVPGLATILVGEDHAAAAYERHVRRLAERLGCEYANEHLPGDAELADVLAVVGKLNADPRVTGILVLRPLPAGISEPLVYRALDPYKDVEAVHPENAGLLAHGRPRFVPSTPASCFYLLDSYLRSAGRDPQTAYAGTTLVVVGRSDSVGKPAASLALQRNATVVTCHSRTADLASFTRQADILIVAAGVAGLVTGDMVRDGVIAVDVGIDGDRQGAVRGRHRVRRRRGEGGGDHARPRRRGSDHRRVADRERRERRRGRPAGRAALRRRDVSAEEHHRATGSGTALTVLLALNVLADLLSIAPVP
jgi:methylenetetrahydrofolate dehydrogenase (NADP+)/methenyltetrahydrofolate cyclohydrolase